MNTKLLVAVLALVAVVAFSGCIGGDEPADNSTGYTDAQSGNNPEGMDVVGPEVTEQIDSELISEGDSVVIGEMI